MHFIFREAGEKWTERVGDKTVEHITDVEQIFLYVEADSMRILMKKPLEVIIGKLKIIIGESLSIHFLG